MKFYEKFLKRCQQSLEGGLKKKRLAEDLNRFSPFLLNVQKRKEHNQISL